LIECAGNGRVFLEPPQIGVRWELGAVGTAQWTGVPLAALLARAGVKPEAVDVVLVGADRGEFKYPQPPSEGEIPFARALPLSKAQDEEVLLAYAMNGQPLPREHGYPVRAIVPGWYGVASVKWLERIVVLDRSFHGYFHVFQYSLWERHDDLRDLTPVTELQVKAQIARPGPHEVVDAGHPYLIRGAAWTGEGEIVCVEVSTDAGATWSEARLLTPAIAYTWRLWEYPWQVPEQPGRHVLMARATDAAGNTQPLERDADRRDTMITHVLPLEVEAVEAR
jgi:DMSO/TMAO reductase YedYZ molybdopterin-dependent catalytic subunit